MQNISWKLSQDRKKAEISEPSINSRIKLDDCFVYGIKGQCWVRVCTAESGLDAESVCPGCCISVSINIIIT